MPSQLGVAANVRVGELEADLGFVQEAGDLIAVPTNPLRQELQRPWLAEPEIFGERWRDLWMQRLPTNRLFPAVRPWSS